MLESLGDRIVPNAAPVASNVITDFHPNGSAVFLYPSATDADNDTVVLDSYSAPSHGTIEWMYSNALQYRPDPGYIGTDSFTYTVTDGNGGYSTATMTVNLWNTDPTANDTSESVHGGQGVWVYPTMGDADGDSVGMVSTSTPAKGTLTMYSNAIYYTATPGEEGADAITVTVSDGVGGTSTATITFNVLNDPPVANDDSFSVNEDGYIISGTTALFINDTAVDTPQQHWTAQLVSGASHGYAVVWADGTFGYVPDADWNGTDSFTYRIWDGHDYSNEATVTITVGAVNDDPVAESTIVELDAGGNVTFSPVLTDADGDTITITTLGSATYGGVVQNLDGSITYTPTDPYWTGTDSFTYTVSDGNGGTATATISFIVNATESSDEEADENGEFDFTEEQRSVAMSLLESDVDDILHEQDNIVARVIDANLKKSAYVQEGNPLIMEAASTNPQQLQAYYNNLATLKSAYDLAAKDIEKDQIELALKIIKAESKIATLRKKATASENSDIDLVASQMPANVFKYKQFRFNSN